ncbi:MAG: homocysteine methyltransferase [Bryobacterales bacterium]|nr:homocysteine methyltransferase [Bryobacterales bacterium]
MPSLPDAAGVLDLIEAFRRSKTMFTAVSLGLFDRLAAGPAETHQIRRPDEDLDTLERLLDACVSLGLLEKHGAAFANSPAADAYLRRDSPRTMTGYIRYSNEVLWPMWGNFEDAVREGTHRWKQTFGCEGPLFSAYYQTEDRKREFLLGMHGFGCMTSPTIVTAFDLSRFRRMVDLGGATGHLPAAALERYPQMTAAVLDLAPVIAFAREFTAGTRVELIEGDFFTDDLPPADLYTLGRILHDWSEDKIRRLLARIYTALPTGGALLIAEKLLRDDLSGPVSAHMQSLNMLIGTEGRERSFAQYAELLQEAGFAEMEGKVTGTPLDAVLAVKK